MKRKKPIRSQQKKTETVVILDDAQLAGKILIEPWITEKSHASIADNKYAFRTVGNATKKQVKTAVEGIYGVKVEKITAINNIPKRKSYGRYGGMKSAIRKMTVTLKKGDKIELFKGA